MAPRFSLRSALVALLIYAVGAALTLGWKTESGAGPRELQNFKLYNFNSDGGFNGDSQYWDGTAWVPIPFKPSAQFERVRSYVVRTEIGIPYTHTITLTHFPKDKNEAFIVRGPLRNWNAFVLDAILPLAFAGIWLLAGSIWARRRATQAHPQ